MPGLNTWDATCNSQQQPQLPLKQHRPLVDGNQVAIITKTHQRKFKELVETVHKLQNGFHGVHGMLVLVSVVMAFKPVLDGKSNKKNPKIMS